MIVPSSASVNTPIRGRVEQGAELALAGGHRFLRALALRDVDHDALPVERAGRDVADDRRTLARLHTSCPSRWSSRYSSLSACISRRASASAAIRRSRSSGCTSQLILLSSSHSLSGYPATCHDAGFERRSLDVATALAGLAILAACAAVARSGSVGPLEREAFEAINGLQDAPLAGDAVGQLLGVLAVGPIAVIVALLLRRWRLAVAAALVRFHRQVAAERVVWQVVQRDRPGTTIADAIVRGRPRRGCRSFRSRGPGHQSRLGGDPYLRSWWRLAPWAVFVVVVAFARIYLGAHAPSTSSAAWGSACSSEASPVSRSGSPTLSVTCRRRGGGRDGRASRSRPPSSGPFRRCSMGSGRGRARRLPRVRSGVRPTRGRRGELDEVRHRSARRERHARPRERVPAAEDVAFGEAETNDAPHGITKPTPTSVAVPGPAFVTVQVYASGAPGATLAGPRSRTLTSATPLAGRRGRRRRIPVRRSPRSRPRPLPNRAPSPRGARSR